MTASGYSKIERNETDVTINRLEKIAEILEVDMAKILNFDARSVFHIQTINGTNTGTVENQEFHSKDEVWKELVAQLKSENEFLRSKIK